MLLGVSSTWYKICLSTAHTFPKPYLSLAPLNLLIGSFVKLSVMERFWPFNLFLLLKTLCLLEYLKNFKVMGRHLWFTSLKNCFISNFLPHIFDAMYQMAVFSGVLLLSFYLLLYFTSFCFPEKTQALGNI